MHMCVFVYFSIIASLKLMIWLILFIYYTLGAQTQGLVHAEEALYY